MDVAAADPDDSNFKENIVVVFYGWLRQIDYLCPSYALQHGCFHYKFSGNKLIAALLFRTAKHRLCL